MTGRFYPWWVECWGGMHVWEIRDREAWRKTHPTLPKRIESKIAAQRLCARMNADWERFVGEKQQRVG